MFKRKKETGFRDVESIEEIKGERNLAYEKAREEYFDRYMKQSKAIHTWKISTFIMSGFFVLTFMVSIYLTTRSSIVPYIIEVDQFGATKNIGKIDQIKYTPNDAEINYFIREFVSNARNVPRDSVLYGKNYKTNLQFLDERLINKYNAIIQAENFEELLMTKRTVSIKIVALQKVTGTNNSYQVRWDESFYDSDGKPYDGRRMSAIVSIAFTVPKTLEEIQTNPLGLKVLDLNLTREE